MPLGRPVELDRKPVSAGRRNRAVVVERLQAGTSTSGFPVEDWVPLQSEPIWMSREDISADERFVNNQQSAFINTVWRLAYREDMDPEIHLVPKRRRVNDRGRIYDIQSAAIVGNREAIVLMSMAKADEQ